MDIDLYVDSIYNGFFPMDVIEEFFEEHKQEAEEMLTDANDGEIIVYAVIKYEQDSEKIIYVNLMTEKMSYQKYVEICESDDEYRRYFFVKKDKVRDNEN
jgi:hypothetical protein